MISELLIGVAALEVETISRFSSAFRISHAQPEPNVVNATLLNSIMNDSRLPHLFTIAS